MTSSSATILPSRSAVPDRPDHSRFPVLDGLRAVAVGCVVLTHCAFWTGHYGRGPGSSLLGHLDIGVAIFFVISGFLLSREWFVAAAAARQPLRTRAYLWRRALRILPLYWITVVIALLALPENRHTGLSGWLHQLTLTQIYPVGAMRQGLTQTWSLCTEAAFYLLLPVLAGAIVRLGGRRLAGASVCFAVVAIAAGIAWNAWYWSASSVLPSSAVYWLPSDIGWFAAGIAMAGIHSQLTQLPYRSERWSWAVRLGENPGGCWALAGGCYLLIVTPLTGSVLSGPANPGQAVTKNLLYLATASLVVWPAVFAQTPSARALLGNRVMRYLGDISYGIFLLHLAIIDLVTRMLGDPLFGGSILTVTALTLVLTIPAAMAGFHGVERPVQRYRNWVPASRPSPRAPLRRARR